MLFEENERNKIPNTDESLNNPIFNPFAFNPTTYQTIIENKKNFISINPITKILLDPKENIVSQKITDDFKMNKNLLNSTKIASYNTIIIILNSIVMSVMFFCRLMLVDIIKFSSINQALFLDSLIKYVNFYL